MNDYPQWKRAAWWVIIVVQVMVGLLGVMVYGWPIFLHRWAIVKTYWGW